MSTHRRSPHPSLTPLFDAMRAANLGTDPAATARGQRIATLLRAAQSGGPQ